MWLGQSSRFSFICCRIDYIDYISLTNCVTKLLYWWTECFAARVPELNKFPCQHKKISYTVEIKYRRTQVKEIRYQQLPVSNFFLFRVWVSSPPPTLFTMGPEMRSLLLRYFDFNTISMHRIGSKLFRLISWYQPCIWLVSLKPQEYFLGYCISLHLLLWFSFFQGPSSISCFKSCCDCCRTRDVIFRWFL